MLRQLRQGGVTKAIMGVVVVLIIAAFAFTSVGPGVGVNQTVACVVEVEGTCVSPKDYDMLIRLTAPRGATDKEMRKLGFNGLAVNALVERELLLREARRLGVAVSEDALDDELALGRVHFSWPVDAPVPSSAARGYPYPVTGATPMVTYIRVRNSKTDAFDFEIYRRQVQSLLRMSPREFKERQEQELIAARVRELVTSGVRVAEAEAFADFERKRSKATVRSVNISNTWFERFVVDASDAAAQAFAAQHAAEVDAKWQELTEAWTADCPLIAELLVGFTPGADADERAEKGELARRYEKLIEAGAPLSTIARVYGTNEAARFGGALGCLDPEKYGAGGEELAQAVEKLKPGQTSEVIETPRGFHVVQLLGKLSAEEAQERGRLEAARRLSIESAAREASKRFAEQLIERVKNGADLSAAVDELVPENLNVAALPKGAVAAFTESAKLASDVPVFEVSRPFTRTSSPLPGLKASDVSSRVFALPEANAVIEEPLETFSGYAVIQLKEKDLATREAFEEEKAEIMAALKEQKRAEALSNYLARLRERAKQIAVDPAYAGSGRPVEDDSSEPAGAG